MEEERRQKRMERRETGWRRAQGEVGGKGEKWEGRELVEKEIKETLERVKEASGEKKEEVKKRAGKVNGSEGSDGGCDVESVAERGS